MRNVQSFFLVLYIFFIFGSADVYAQKKNSFESMGYSPHVVVRDIGFGLALTGGATLVASGVLGIVMAIERSRFEGHFSNASSHAEFIALNESYVTGTKLSYCTSVLLGIGIVQTSIGLGFFIGGLVVGSQKLKKQHAPDTTNEPVLVHVHKNDWIIARVSY